MIDFEFDGNNSDLKVILSGRDRNDMIPMLGYIIRNHVLPKHIIKYFLSICQKKYGNPFLKWSGDMELKCFFINIEDIRFVLQEKQKQTVVKLKKQSCEDCIDDYDWGEDAEVLNYIESDERFQEPVISFPKIEGGKGN